jgi:putative molybdopterin biosynthesis protein
LTRKLVSPAGDDDFVRVSLAQVNGRWLATPLGRGAGVITSLVRADGLAHIPRFNEGVDMGGTVSVKLYRPLETLRQTLLLMGSHDPLLDLFGQSLSAHVPAGRLVSTHIASLGGLVALRRGEAHLAGSHLFDPDSNTYNWPAIHKYLAGRDVRVVTFAHREQGLMVAHGNPLGIQSLDDLVRVRYVNRQAGAGTRVLLDYELARRGLTPEQVTGYKHEEYTHLGVAAAVASGLADCGMGVRSGAVALGLDFIPVTWERYDWVIPAESESLPLLQAALEVLNSAAWRAVLAGQAGYDGRETGQVQPEPA